MGTRYRFPTSPVGECQYWSAPRAPHCTTRGGGHGRRRGRGKTPRPSSVSASSLSSSLKPLRASSRSVSPRRRWPCGMRRTCGTMLASESLLSPELDSLSPLDGLLCSATSDTSDAPWLQGGGSGGGGDGSIGDATLLMALAETLDSLDDNTASPFDGLLDSEPRLLACDVDENSTLLRHLCTLESAAYSPVGSGGSAVCDWEGSGSGSSGEDMPEKRDGSAEGFCASGESGASSSSNDEDDIGMLLPEGDVEELQKLMAMDGSFEFDVIDLKEGSVVELVSYMHTYCVRDSVASLSLLSPVKAPCGPAVLAGGTSPDGGSSSASFAGSSANVGGSEGGEEQARGTDDGGDGGTAVNGTGFLGPLDGLCESSSLDCGSEKASLGRDAKEQAERSAGAVAATGTAAPAAVTPGPEEISAATFPAAKAEREDKAGAEAENGNAVPFAVPQKRPRGRPRTRNVNGQQEPGAAAAAAAAAMTKKAVRSILFEEPPRRSVRISKAKKETRQSDAAQRGQARPPPERVAHPALARVDFNRTTAEVETKPIVVVQQQQLKLSKVIGGLAVSSSSTSLMTRPAPSSLSAPSALVSVSAPSPLPASASSVSISSPAPSSAIAKPTPSALVTPPTVMTLSSPVPPPLLTILSSMPPPSSSPSSSLATPSSSTLPSSVLPSSTAPSSRTPPLSTLSVAPSPSVPSVALSTVPPSLSAPPSTSMTPPLSPASSAPPPDGEAPPAVPLDAVPPDANAEEESGAKRRRISLLQYRRRMEERGLELGPHAAGGAGVQPGLAEQSGADDAASAEQLGRDESKAAAVGVQAVLPADAPAEAAAESTEDDNYLETDPTIRAFFEEIGIEASDLGSLLQQFEESEGRQRWPDTVLANQLPCNNCGCISHPGVIAPSTSLHPKPDAKVNLASRGTSAKRKAPRSPRKRGIPLAGKMPRLEAATKQPCSGQLAPSTPAAAQAASGRFAPAAGTVPTAGARMIPTLPAGVGAAAQDPPCVSAPNAVGPVTPSEVEQQPPPARASLGVASPSVVADKTLSLPASQPVVNRTPPCQSDALPNPVRVAIPAAASAKMLSSTKNRSRGSQDRRCGEGRHRAPTIAAGGGSLSSSPGRRDSVSPPSAAAASPHQRGRQRSRSRSGYGRRYRSSGGGRSSSSTTTSSHRRSVSPVPSFSSDVPRSRRPSPRFRRSERPWLERRESNVLDQRRRLHQKAIEERRVIYVGKINSAMTTLELRRRFQSFGEIENCSVHFRERGDNYGFVTYRFTCDAFAALEKGHMVHLPNEIPFDLCFGGRRQFCKASYADLDSNRGLERSTDRRTAMAPLDFDSLLKAAKQHGM
ncbi:unnamed protein product [Lampetra planeri]